MSSSGSAAGSRERVWGEEEAIKSQRVFVGPIKRDGFLELSVHI